VARNGRLAMLTLQSPSSPRRLWALDLVSLDLSPVTSSPVPEGVAFVEPELLSFGAHDGLPLSAWLYRASQTPGPVVISLHGGPESQERPTWEPLYQCLLAAGISVLAPNVRGSSGFGRFFEHADDRYGRYDAIADVRRCIDVLLARGVGEWGRIAVTGWSYGGYLSMAALTFYPSAFAAGVTVCGMSDLLTFYRDTEPWIAAAAVSKYGDPVRDRTLLHDLSPLHHIDRMQAPVLAIHGELDTNVPVGESRRLAAALSRVEHPVSYLQMDGEGHEFRRLSARLRVIEAQLQFLVEQLVPSARPLGAAH
jgi:dipeptidyl aminopeptidase/acylaminoacyl peptidase